MTAPSWLSDETESGLGDAYEAKGKRTQHYKLNLKQNVSLKKRHY